jgi:hypothetical protein
MVVHKYVFRLQWVASTFCQESFMFLFLGTNNSKHNTVNINHVRHVWEVKWYFMDLLYVLRWFIRPFRLNCYIIIIVIITLWYQNQQMHIITIIIIIIIIIKGKVTPLQARLWPKGVEV